MKINQIIKIVLILLTYSNVNSQYLKQNWLEFLDIISSGDENNIIKILEYNDFKMVKNINNMEVGKNEIVFYGKFENLISNECYNEENNFAPIYKNVKRGTLIEIEISKNEIGELTILINADISSHLDPMITIFSEINSFISSHAGSNCYIRNYPTIIEYDSDYYLCTKKNENIILVKASNYYYNYKKDVGMNCRMGHQIKTSIKIVNKSKSNFKLNKGTIKFKTIGKLKIIKVRIGPHVYDYILDSGASYMTITNKMEVELKNIGIIKESDYLGYTSVMLADNSIVTCKKIMLSIVNVGEINVAKVEVLVTNGSKLLGQTVLSKFKKWKIDNVNKCLIIE